MAKKKNEVMSENEGGEQRTIILNSLQQEKFCNNKVITAKYNVFTFIPKSLWEQFHVYSNCFFLFIVILQQIPGVSPTGRFTTAVPLSFILLVSMIKQLIEDYRLHKSDQEVNNSLISAFRNGSWEKVKWKDLMVGDIVRVTEDIRFPADLVLLASSEPQGMCYIQTSNLDGETNLKIRQAPPPKVTVGEDEAQQPLADDSELRALAGTVECERPTRFLYEFTGNLRVQDREPFPLGSEQLLLRGSQLKNTKWIIGVCVYTGHETKIMLNAMLPSLKRSSIEKTVNRQILILFIILITLCLISAIGNTVYNHLRLDKDWYLGFSSQWWMTWPRRIPTYFRRKQQETMEEIRQNPNVSRTKFEEKLLHVKDRFYSEMVTSNFGYIFLTFVILYNNLIPISLQVTVEIIRFCQAYFINVDEDMYDKESETYATARTSSLNEELGQIKYIFSDKTGTLTRNEMEFKKCSVGGNCYGERNEKDTVYEDPNFAQDLRGSGTKSEVLRQFMTVLAVCHTVIPLNKEKPASHAPSLAHIKKATDNDEENLSDKASSHTATSSAATSSQILHHGQDRKESGGSQEQAKAVTDGQGLKSNREARKNFISSLCPGSDLCCRGSKGGPGKSAKHSATDTDSSGAQKEKSDFHGSSPDECALLEGAQKLGYVFERRNGPTKLVVRTLDTEQEFEILNVLDFTSDRKRMSVIVRCPPGYLDPPTNPNGQSSGGGQKNNSNNRPQNGTEGSVQGKRSDQDRRDKKGGGQGDILLMCKGADSVIYDLLGTDENAIRYRDSTMKDMEMFAIQGLRTLCVAIAPIDAQEYEQWNKVYQEAKLSIKDRDKKVDEAFAQIEKNFELLGATAIEDKLQEGVPETLTKLAQAGIKTWVLTGDKQETAINIGYSCSLLTKDTPLLIVNEDNAEAVKDILHRYCVQLGDRVRKDNRVALIIDGKSLKFALSEDARHDFLDVILSCQTILCCRTTPLQKSEVVQLIRSHTTHSTLAIGDGSNDVAMIHAAHVGVGISGKEGLQAANSSDFSISQFRFLTKLLLVHGAWNHSRMCKLILYQFYKNICMYIIELWFAIISYFSGQPLFERWTLGLYNVAFTVLPPAAIGLFDRTCSAKSCLKFPVLYTESLRSQVFNVKIFWYWIMNAVIHSLCIFWFSFAIQMHDVVWSSGKTGDYLVLGNFIYTYVVIVVCLKSGLVTYSWTIMTQIAIWGSIIVWMLFLVVYSFIWPYIPIAAEMCGEVTLIYSSPAYWLGLILVPAMTLFPDFSIKVLQRSLCPSLIEKVRKLEIANEDPSDVISKATKITLYWVLNKMFATLQLLDEEQDVKSGRPEGTAYNQRMSTLPLSLQNHLRKLSRDLEKDGLNVNEIIDNSGGRRNHGPPDGVKSFDQMLLETPTAKDIASASTTSDNKRGPNNFDKSGGPEMFGGKRLPPKNLAPNLSNVPEEQLKSSTSDNSDYDYGEEDNYDNGTDKSPNNASSLNNNNNSVFDTQGQSYDRNRLGEGRRTELPTTMAEINSPNKQNLDRQKPSSRL